MALSLYRCYRNNRFAVLPPLIHMEQSNTGAYIVTPWPLLCSCSVVSQKKHEQCSGSHDSSLPDWRPWLSNRAVGLPGSGVKERCLCWLGLQWKTLEEGAHMWGRVGAGTLVGMAGSKLTAFIFAFLVPYFRISFQLLTYIKSFFLKLIWWLTSLKS